MNLARREATRLPRGLFRSVRGRADDGVHDPFFVTRVTFERRDG
jgi:hypothetical protein